MKGFFTSLLFVLLCGAMTPLVGAQGNVVPSDVQMLENTSLSPQQVESLLYAKHIALDHCPVTDVTECRTLMRVAVGIVWQESRAGEQGPVGDIKNGFGRRSYGVMQVKLHNALEMLKGDGELRDAKFPAGAVPYTEEEVIALLLTDKHFNIEIGIDLLEHLHFSRKLSWASTVRAYNQGEPHRNNEKAKLYYAQYQEGEKSPELHAILAH